MINCQHVPTFIDKPVINDDVILMQDAVVRTLVPDQWD